jgi:hypothetical protein
MKEIRTYLRSFLENGEKDTKENMKNTIKE